MIDEWMNGQSTNLLIPTSETSTGLNTKVLPLLVCILPLAFGKSFLISTIAFLPVSSHFPPVNHITGIIYVDNFFKTNQ
jgi:hypothetical protein